MIYIQYKTYTVFTDLYVNIHIFTLLSIDVCMFIFLNKAILLYLT